MFQFNPSVNSIDPSGPQDVTHIPLSVIIPEPMTWTSVSSELVFVFDKVKIKACRFGCGLLGFDCGLIKICSTGTPLVYIYFHCSSDPDFTFYTNLLLSNISGLHAKPWLPFMVIVSFR